MATEPIAEYALRPSFPLGDRLRRQCWTLVWLLFFRPTPRPFHGWRRFVLRCFGAQVGRHAHIYAGAKIWAPWNLVVGAGAAIADGVEVYNPSTIEIREGAIVSQGAYLCGASHEYESRHFRLVSKPIVVGARAWVAARAIVQMGVTLGDGCVVAAGSVVTRDMPAWTVCAGVPCRPIRAYERT
jgi:putative colanic acid biosynthesis acetyltransferase WcaF